MSKFENCKNCNGLITCGCEYQLASDGTNCCDACIKDYEAKLKASKDVLVEPWGSMTEEIEKKINENNYEQSSDELSLGTAEETDDEQS